MAVLPMSRRSPLKSMLDFAVDREREANSIGDVITRLAEPLVGPALMTGPVPQAQPLGAFTGQPMQATPVDFNPRSMDLLGAADPRLRELMLETERRARDQGIEIQVSETARDPNRQAALVQQGKSQTMNSRHLTGNAADIYVQNPDGSANWDFAAYQPVADIAKEVAAEKGYDDFVWGGDWNTLKDGVHFQLGGSSAAGANGSTTMTGGAGADRLTGDMNVEDILARLYPEESEQDARTTRRRDLLAGVGQVLTALDRGQAPDVSNIRAQQEQRRRQAVVDMRERERARAAASLVYAQTNDADMAAAVASGAVNVETAFSERERRRIEKEADKRRLQQEAAAGNLADLFISVAPDLGLSEEQTAKITEGIKAGTPLDTLMSPIVLQKTAEASRLAEETAATAKEQRDAYTQTLLESDNPVERAAGQFLLGDPEMSVKDALTTANTVYGVSAKDDPVSIAEANLLFEGGAINPLTNQKFASEAEALLFVKTYKGKGAAPGEISLQYSPDSGFSITAGVPAAGAPAAGTPAAGGAVVDVADAAPGTATVVQDGQLVSVPVVGSPEYDAAILDIETQEQALAQAIATAPSVEARAAAEAQLAQVQAQKAALTMPTEVATAEAELAAKEQALAQAIATAPSAEARAAAEAQLAQVQAQKAALTMPTEVAAAEVELAAKRQTLESAIANAPNALEKAQLETELLRLERDAALSNQSVDAATKEAQLASIEADVAKKQAEVEALEREEAQKSSAQYKNAVQQFGQVNSAVKTVVNNANSGWATGVAGGIATTIGGALNIPTLRTEVLSAAKQIGSQAMLDALKEAKAAGVALTPVSNLDIAVLGASESPLLEPEALRGDRLVEAVADRYNYLKDQLFGPKDLTRLDQYGNEYTVGQNTLGVSADEFSYHWAQIPPEVAAAWKNGELPLFPTDDPEYADAATMLNALTANWNVYQGDLDRTLVGEAETPSEPTDAADLPPPPPGMPADEWPGTWQFMSQEKRDAYIKQTQGAK